MNNTPERSPGPTDFEDIASEIGSEPAFVEKEWFGIQLLAHLSAFKSSGGECIVFAGGTCLARAHGIIRRFSEDLDFIVRSNGVMPRGKIREFRAAMLDHLAMDDRFKFLGGRSANMSGFYRAHFSFSRHFEHASLRPFIKLELSFLNNRLGTSKEEVRSTLAELRGGAPEAVMECVSPLETAADKISALTWRVVERKRGSPDDDPRIIRHLHDLAELKDTIERNFSEFRDAAKDSLSRDQKERAGGGIAGMTVLERLEKAMDTLYKDPAYPDEYRKFVEEMSYVPDDERIGYSDALGILQGLVKGIGRE